MTTIAGWLKDIGLEDQESFFAGHDIDMEVLPTLTEADLRELGLSMGVRKKMLKAIAGLNHRDQAASAKRTASEPIGHAASPSSNAPESASAAERRQLTVLFCDLVGSTQLSQQLDPETLRDLMKNYQQACRVVIEKYDGHVAQYLGDGLMVYFGFPRAHEDDAERAARAALEIISSVKKVAAPSALCVRIGIATGRVVVGETGAGDASVPKLAVGETPNLAARLQGLAGRDEIVVAPSTHRLLGTVFEFLDLGEKTLKGIVEPVHAFQVLGAAATEGRFEASHREQLAPIIGRESEIALLIDRWQQSQAGEGQVALLAGEPGIGKSRITRALRERVGSTPHLRLRFQCSPYHANSAFYPLIQHLERAAGFLAEDTPEQKLGKIEAIWLDTGTARPESLALIAALLALPIDRYPPLAYAPHKQKEKTLHALLVQIEALAHQEALLLVFEDAHWIDPTTQEWLDLLVTRLPVLRAFLIVTHRPEYTARWGAQAHVTTLALNRLGKRQGTQLVERVSGGKPLPREVLEQILAKTDGVPLFVEEITTWVLESRLLKEEANRYVLTGPLPPLAIPSTLHDSLMARLDRLASVKEVAQIAACIGREFSHELLAAVATLEPEQFEAAVSQLIDAQLIFRVSSAAGTAYIFKHALVQDAAYESLLKSKRQQLHASIAEALVQGFPEQAGLAPDVVARHYTQASLNKQAVIWWRKASALAIRRNAPVEAIDHCNKGLEVLAFLEHNAERDRTELGIHLELGSAVLSIMGWADPRAGQAFERAMALSQTVGGTPDKIQAMYGLGAYYMVTGDQRSAVEITTQYLEFAEPLDDLDARISAHFLHGIVQQMRGYLTEALEHLTRSLELIGPGYRENQLVRFGQDYKASALFWKTRTLWYLGYPDQSAQYLQKSLDYARERAHPYCWGWAFGNAELMGPLTGADLGLYEKGLEHCQEYGYPLWVALITASHGGNLTWQGKPQEGLDRLNEAVPMCQAIGMDLWMSWHLALKSAALLSLGDSTAGLVAIEQAMGYANKCDEPVSLSEIYRVQGELFLVATPPKTHDAKASFERGLAIAREQGGKSFELRVATSYARFLKNQGSTKEARDLLQPIYHWFTEGFDTRDLKEAKVLLDELPELPAR